MQCRSKISFTNYRGQGLRYLPCLSMLFWRLKERPNLAVKKWCTLHQRTVTSFTWSAVSGLQIKTLVRNEILTGVLRTSISSWQANKVKLSVELSKKMRKKQNLKAKLPNFHGFGKNFLIRFLEIMISKGCLGGISQKLIRDSQYIPTLALNNPTRTELFARKMIRNGVFS